MIHNDGICIIRKNDIELPDRAHVTNKGDCGRLLVVGGDSGMAGAVAFTAESAYRMGVGLVNVLTHGDNRIPIQILVPEAIASLWGDGSIKFDSCSAVAIGVGMGKSDMARKLFYRIISCSMAPTVIDADGLNILADTPELFEFIGENTVLTPHIMEFSRLSGKSVAEIKKDSVSSAREFALRYSTNVILKDKVSVIVLADGTTFLNESGNSTLSKGGSGDILTGMIASLLAQGMSISKALPAAAYLHGLCGVRAGEKLTQRSALARDVISTIPEVLWELD